MVNRGTNSKQLCSAASNSYYGKQFCLLLTANISPRVVRVFERLLHFNRISDRVPSIKMPSHCVRDLKGEALIKAIRLIFIFAGFLRVSSHFFLRSSFSSTSPVDSFLFGTREPSVLQPRLMTEGRQKVLVTVHDEIDTFSSGISRETGFQGEKRQRVDGKMRLQNIREFH